MPNRNISGVVFNSAVFAVKVIHIEKPKLQLYANSLTQIYVFCSFSYIYIIAYYRLIHEPIDEPSGCNTIHVQNPGNPGTHLEQ